MILIYQAARSGTTSLWRYLSAHPEICMGRRKEPDFFTLLEGVGDVPDGIHSRYSGRYARGLTWYRNQFRHCETGQRTGEASTLYLTQPDSAELIHRHLPDVQLLFILRNPVDRLYSHYCWEHAGGWRLPNFDQVVQARGPLYQTYHYGSSYQRHVERFLALFPREQMRVIITEELQKNTQAILDDIWRFLGIQPFHLAAERIERHNQGRVPRFKGISLVARNVARHLLDSRWAPVLRPILGGSFSLLSRLNSRDQPYPPLDSPMRIRLSNEFLETRAYVEDFLGRPIPSWRP
jgi:hypothetical protein